MKRSCSTRIFFQTFLVHEFFFLFPLLDFYFCPPPPPPPPLTFLMVSPLVVDIKTVNRLNIVENYMHVVSKALPQALNFIK